MATNADEATTEEQSEEVTDAEEELRQAKAEAKDKLEAEETEQEDKPTESAEAKETQESEATFTKEVPSIPGETPEEYYKNLAKAYSESTKEALRLKGELDKKTEINVEEDESIDNLTPEQLYIRQKQDEEIRDAFNDISQKYPQLKEEDTYKKFVAEANVLGRVIVETDKRFPSPKELYQKTVVLLGLTPDNSDELGAALKSSAASSRTQSSTPANSPKSKVTEDMIATNLKMYPGKTRQEIIEELEPHIA